MYVCIYPSGPPTKWEKNTKKTMSKKSTPKKLKPNNVEKVGLYILIYLHIPPYTSIYLHIPPNSFIYLHIPPYTLKY